MSHVFYGAWLVRRGGLGWATHEAEFANRRILAHIQLSALHLQDGDTFQMFRQQYALAYIETVNTPSGIWGIPNPNKETDNNVWLTTDHLTFKLQVDGVVTASAFGLIHDLDSGADSEAKVTYSRDLAVFDDDGRVVGTHRVVQLDGGRRIDLDAVQERVLERAVAQSDRNVDVVPVDLDGIPADAEFRINLRTRRPAPPRDSNLS
jgi:hypothetical protein